MNLADWAAAAIAVVTHLFTLGCAVTGLWLVFGVGTVFPIVAGVLLIGLAALMRPRLGRLPRHEIVVHPDRAPALYDLVRQVADRLSARQVWRIVLVADYTAALTAYGIRRRPVLYLGYPLWNLLDERERIALLGHEIAHCVNGDLRSGLLVGSSLRSLHELRQTMLDTRLSGAGTQVLTNVLMVVLSLPVLGLCRLQELLLARSGRRREFYADRLAARLAGGGATRSMLAKLSLGEQCLLALNTAVIRRDPDIWAAARDWYAGLTEDDRTRLATRAEAKYASVDATHPPTSERIAAVEDHPPADLAVESTAIDGELAALLRPVTEIVRQRAIG